MDERYGIPGPNAKIDARTRRIMEWQARIYAEIEVPADVEPWGEQRAQRLAAINVRRAMAGRPPLENDEESNPDLASKREAAYRRYISEGS